MKISLLQSATATLSAALGASLLLGSATDHNRQPTTLSDEQAQTVYPPQYLDTVDPLHRSNVERSMINEENRRKR